MWWGNAGRAVVLGICCFLFLCKIKFFSYLLFFYYTTYIICESVDVFRTYESGLGSCRCVWPACNVVVVSVAHHFWNHIFHIHQEYNKRNILYVMKHLDNNCTLIKPWWGHCTFVFNTITLKRQKSGFNLSITAILKARPAQLSPLAKLQREILLNHLFPEEQRLSFRFQCLITYRQWCCSKTAEPFCPKPTVHTFPCTASGFRPAVSSASPSAPSCIARP